MMTVDEQLAALRARFADPDRGPIESEAIAYDALALVAQVGEERDDLSKKLAAVWTETVADLEAENARLDAENRRLREERDAMRRSYDGLETIHVAANVRNRELAAENATLRAENQRLTADVRWYHERTSEHDTVEKLRAETAGLVRAARALVALVAETDCDACRRGDYFRHPEMGAVRLALAPFPSESGG